jgi:hypothetical protein
VFQFEELRNLPQLCFEENKTEIAERELYVSFMCRDTGRTMVCILSGSNDNDTFVEA